MSAPELKPDTPRTSRYTHDADETPVYPWVYASHMATMEAELESALNEWNRVERSLVALAEHMGWNQSEPFVGSGPIEQRIGTALVQFINLQSALNAAREAIEKLRPILAQRDNSYFFDMLKEWEEDFLPAALAQISPQQSKTT